MADQDDPARVATCGPRMPGQPRDRLADIIGLSREADPSRIGTLRVEWRRGEAVVDGRKEVAATREELSLLAHADPLIALAPAAAMDPDDDRRRGRSAARCVQVEAVLS